MMTRTLWTTLAVVGILAGSGWAAGQPQNQPQGPTVVTPAPLTALETANLLHLRNEEKLARDVYRTLAGKWNCPAFTNIAGAAQRHLDAVGLLMAKYGLQDPAPDDTVGVFADPEFTQLYTTLTQSGAKSLLDAFKAGVEIEQADLASLKTALSQTDKSDIQWVLGNLQRASSNHRRAFTRHVEAGGAGCPLQGLFGGRGNGRGLGGSGVCPGYGRQGLFGGGGNGSGPGNGVCAGYGRGGRGHGNCYRNGNGRGNPGGAGRGNGLQKRDGSCLTPAPAQM